MGNYRFKMILRTKSTWHRFGSINSIMKTQIISLSLLAAVTAITAPAVGSPAASANQNQRVAPPGLNQMPGNGQNNNGQYNQGMTYTNSYNQNNAYNQNGYNNQNNQNGYNNQINNGGVENAPIGTAGNLPVEAQGIAQNGTPGTSTDNNPQNNVPYNGQQPGGVPGSSPYGNPQNTVPYNNGGGPNSTTNNSQPMLTNSPPSMTNQFPIITNSANNGSSGNGYPANNGSSGNGSPANGSSAYGMRTNQATILPP